MYLHEGREQFLDAIRMAAGHMGMSEIVIEKDYYVTMILRLLSQKLPFVVFKGGTSFTAVSFPTVIMPVINYIGEVMAEEASEIIGEYRIEPFEMKVQELERTLVDKVFQRNRFLTYRGNAAICLATGDKNQAIYYAEKKKEEEPHTKLWQNYAHNCSRPFQWTTAT